MIENENQTSEPQPEGITEGTRDRGLDLFLEHWPRIAATAWGGYVAHGRGAVLMRRKAPAAPTFEYQAGAPCGCHDGLVNDYDPDREAVVAVVKGLEKSRRQQLHEPPIDYAEREAQAEAEFRAEGGKPH